MQVSNSGCVYCLLNMDESYEYALLSILATLTGTPERLAGMSVVSSIAAK